jgi:hypothetical protein
LIACATAVQPGTASAVSMSVQNACMSDYFRYCSNHDVGTRGLRRCMRNNGKRLSRRCVDALAAAGEISGAKVRKRSSRRRVSNAY